jgi:hypothetical protein
VEAVEQEPTMTVARPSDAMHEPTPLSTVPAFLSRRPESTVAHVSATNVEENTAPSVPPARGARDPANSGTELALTALGQRLGDTLDRMVSRRFMPFHPPVEQALASVAARDGVRMIHKALQPTPMALAIGRSIVASACAAWNVSTVADAAQVIVTELLANAVRHAGTPMELQVSLHQRYLRLSVHDGSSAPARLTGPDHEGATDGRGLLVVEALAAAWGSTPTANGKVVWANLLWPADQGANT